MQGVNKKISFLALLFFCIFFSGRHIFARSVDIETPQQIEKAEQEDDEYDLDYDPNSSNNDIIKIWDPWERFNRSMHTFNVGLLRHVVRPVYYNFYTKVTTKGMRGSVSNVINNFRMPIIFANYVLQLDAKNAAKAVFSFTMNSTMGILGFLNPAGHQGVNPPSTDFGITLAKYHIPAGPYLVLPFFGPNDLRGGLSWIGEIAVDPLNYNVLKFGGESPLLDDWVLYTRAVLYGIDALTYTMDNFYDLMEASFDSYALMKDAYGQSQSYKINKARGE